VLEVGEEGVQLRQRRALLRIQPLLRAHPPGEFVLLYFSWQPNNFVREVGELDVFHDPTNRLFAKLTDVEVGKDRAPRDTS